MMMMMMRMMMHRGAHAVVVVEVLLSSCIKWSLVSVSRRSTSLPVANSALAPSVRFLGRIWTTMVHNNRNTGWKKGTTMKNAALRFSGERTNR